jgi:hypothetical protein
MAQDIPAKPAIHALGGLKKAAEKIGAPVSTVQHWQEVDCVRSWRFDQVRRALRADGFDLAEDGTVIVAAPTAEAGE